MNVNVLYRRPADRSRHVYIVHLTSCSRHPKYENKGPFRMPQRVGRFKESGIWKHRRRSTAVWTAAVPEDDLITAKALTAHSADQRQVTNLQFAAGFVSRPPFPLTAQWL
jgi:hypothetical protein